MKILLSAFKPFNNEIINPSLLIANEIKDSNLFDDLELIELNVEYNNDSIKLLNKIKECKPDVILCLGQAGGRRKVNIEYYALNMQSASIKDNADVFIEHNLINSLGKESYISTIDLYDLVKKINNEYLTISYHAGTFICNEIYYNTLEYIYNNNKNIKCAFIHIPFIPTQVENRINIPSLDKNISKQIIIDILQYLTKI